MKKNSHDTGLCEKVSQAIEDMKVELGSTFAFEKLNLAELERRTGVSRMKLRRFKANGFILIQRHRNHLYTFGSHLT